MDTVRETARGLCSEASATNERRLLVLAGGRDAGYRGAAAAVEAAGIDRTEVAAVSEQELPVGAGVAPKRTDELLGTTRACVVFDCHDSCRPNALGRAVGAVDGGGLLVVLTPPLSSWSDRVDGFETTLAVPPFSEANVGDRFRTRLVETLRSHRGIAIVDVDSDRLLKDGRTNPAPRLPTPDERHSTGDVFPDAAYEACRTSDQRDALQACEQLRTKGAAVVLEADRGRGKSSAAGLAAAALAADGGDVLVTAPQYRNAKEGFDRAAELLDTLGALADDARDEDRSPALLADSGGRVRFLSPADAADASADALIVDEAASLPVGTLESLLGVAPSACFATTVRGYEGAGRGFDVRFRETLTETHETTTQVLSEPIRYAPADPVEVWLFRALLLDASPPVDPLVEDVSTAETTYRRLDTDTLAGNERLLREAFGLLVYAHYRTEPNDLARLLDAPNIAARALVADGHVVSVALLAREGGLNDDIAVDVYEGSRIRGNLVPDVLASQLRDPDACGPVGVRTLRIATHHAVRSRGLGSRLLSEIEAELNERPRLSPAWPPGIDYLSVSYGVTPPLLDFWSANDYRPVHLSTTQNDTSGERSVLMVRPLSEAGAQLTDRHERQFYARLPPALTDPLSTADPDIVRGVLSAIDGSVADPVSLTASEWRHVASAASGPGLFDVSPGPFRRLAVRALVDGAVDNTAAERLLVSKVLQAHSWDGVADRLGYVSTRECMRALGDAYEPLVEQYGTDTATEELERYR